MPPAKPLLMRRDEMHIDLVTDTGTQLLGGEVALEGADRVFEPVPLLARGAVGFDKGIVGRFLGIRARLARDGWVRVSHAACGISARGGDASRRVSP